MFFDQNLSTAADVQMVKKDSSNEVQRIIYEEKDNDHQVIETRESRLKKEKPEISASKVTFSACLLFTSRFCFELRRSFSPTCTRGFSEMAMAEQ